MTILLILICKGTTPNPCVKCNRQIKFGAMFDFAKVKVQVFSNWTLCKTDGKFFMKLMIKQRSKLFLSQVSPDALAFMMFPLSTYKKEDIVKFGAKLDVAYKKLQKK